MPSSVGGGLVLYNIYLPAPSNRSPLEAFADLKVAGGDLLEGAGNSPLGCFLGVSFFVYRLLYKVIGC